MYGKWLYHNWCWNSDLTVCETFHVLNIRTLLFCQQNTCNGWTNYYWIDELVPTLFRQHKFCFNYRPIRKLIVFANAICERLTRAFSFSLFIRFQMPVGPITMYLSSQSQFFFRYKLKFGSQCKERRSNAQYIIIIGICLVVSKKKYMEL